MSESTDRCFGVGCVKGEGEAHGHPHSPGPVCYLSAFPSSEVGLPHVFSKQLSELSSIEPPDNQF